MKTPLLTVVAVAAGLLVVQPGLAQTTAKKPEVKQPSGKGLMTRDELRVCLRRQTEISTGATALEQRKSSLDAEKSVLSKAIDAAKGLREEVNGLVDALEKIDLQVRDHTLRVEKWNHDYKEANASQERQAVLRKKELVAEQDSLNGRSKVLNDTRAEALTRYQLAAKQFKDRSTVVDTEIATWNQHGKQLANDLDKALEVQHQFTAECSNLRFLEEDENAIKSGK